MKIMQINSTYGCGSTGQIVKDIDSALWDAGMESVVVYHTANSIPKVGYKVGDIATSKLHAGFARIYGTQGYGSILSTILLNRIIAKEKPNVIHLHNLHSNFVNLNILLSYIAKKNIPTVLTLHDCWFFTGKCFHFLPSNCDKWTEHCGACPRLKMDVPSLFFDRTERVFRDKQSHFQNISNLTVVGCSKWMTELAKCSPIFKNKKITQIYNGVDQTIFFQRSEYERMSIKDELGIKDKFVILGMANKWLIPENREVFKAVAQNKDWTICLIGCSDSQQKALSVLPNVLTIGFVSDRVTLSRYYAMADVFVNLTLVDTLPTVNMEALSCGTPVITYNSAGSPELVSNDATGYIIEQFDIEGLVDKIRRVYKNAICRDTCSKFAQSNYESNRQYGKYIQMYREVKNK